MAISFTKFSWWYWGGKDRETTGSSASSLQNSEFGLGLRESDSVKFTSVGAKIPSSSRRTKRKWSSRQERRVDREYDAVLVPSDGGCLSGSESDDSDWSIGWMEPHAPEFHSGDEGESSFAVLVPCYGRGRNEVGENSKNQTALGAIGELKNGYSAENNKLVEQWLTSLQSS